MVQKEYVVFAMTSHFTGARIEEPRAVHRNVAKCEAITTTYSYSEAVHLAPTLHLSRCSVCNDYHT